ncbi:MAG: MCE family protein [Chitinophagaceae bacterium]|nr:MCE family protein [Chitinophagaceae bacterium]
MKISNETKVGILTVVALVILIVGFNFLKGKDVFNDKTKIYAVFQKVGSLEKSNPVKINGYTVGTVYKLEPTDKNMKGIRVTINLIEDINIPYNSIAFIDASFLGTSAIAIDRGNATTYLKNGDILPTRDDAGIFANLSSEAGPTLVKIRSSLDSLNLVLGNINRLFNTDAKNNLQQTMANLNNATRSLNMMLDPSNSALARSLNNVGSITDNLRKNNDSISLVISNAKQFSQKLSRLDLDRTMDTLQAAVSQLRGTIAKMSSTDGTLGALINDKKLYNQFTDVALSLEILLDDLRAHPKRYVNLSIFGKKDKGGALTSPSKKDTLPK